MAKSIMYVMSNGCGKHKPALMLERFSSATDSSIKYFKQLGQRAKVLDSKFDKSIVEIEDIVSKYEGFQAEICYVLRQIDEGLESNYSSNFSVEETKLSEEEQKRLSDERKLKGKKYVDNLKKWYSETHNNTPLVECFSNDDDVTLERRTLTENLELVQDKFKTLKENFSDLKRVLSEKQIAMYYASLGYNDKYLKKLIMAATSKEGFASEPVDPFYAIATMETEIQPIQKEIAEIRTIVNKFIEIVKTQKAGLKQAKGPVNDQKIQDDTINASYAANQHKGKNL